MNEREFGSLICVVIVVDYGFVLTLLLAAAAAARDFVPSFVSRRRAKEARPIESCRRPFGCSSPAAAATIAEQISGAPLVTHRRAEPARLRPPAWSPINAAANLAQRHHRSVGAVGWTKTRTKKETNVARRMGDNASIFFLGACYYAIPACGFSAGAARAAGAGENLEQAAAAAAARSEADNWASS